MGVIRKAKRDEKFVTLDKEALWNPQLSNKAIGLWARCMSRPDDWTFYVSELQSKIKDGECAIYSAIDELVLHRYVLVLKGSQRSNGKFTDQTTEYIFFEGPATDKMIEAQLAIFREQYQEISWKIGDFKKFFRDRGFLDRGNLDRGNQELLNIENTKTDKKKEKEQKKAAEPPSANASSLSSLLFEALKKIDPHFKTASLDKWPTQFDKLLKERPYAEIKSVIENIEQLNAFYRSQCKNPVLLGKHLFGMLQALKETHRKPVEPRKGVEADKAFLKRVEAFYGPSKLKKHGLEIGHDYLEWSSETGNCVETYKAGDANFKETILNVLEKRGLKVNRTPQPRAA